MAKLESKKIDLSKINNGNEYTIQDGIQPSAVTAAVEGASYAQDVSEYAQEFATHLADTPDTSLVGQVGTPTVELIDNVVNGKTLKKFRFWYLKGQKGDKGDMPTVYPTTTLITSNTTSVTKTTVADYAQVVVNDMLLSNQGANGLAQVTAIGESDFTIKYLTSYANAGAVTSVDGKTGDVNLQSVYLPIINKTLPSLGNNNVPQSTLKEFCDSFNLKLGESTTLLYFESGASYSNIKGFIDAAGVVYKQYNFLQITRQASDIYVVTIFAGYNAQSSTTEPPQYFFVTLNSVSPATGANTVRTDAAQSLTTAEKQQAQENLALQGNATLTTPAWYKIASVSIGYIAKIIRVKLTSSWGTDRPFSAEAIIAIAANSNSETTITTVGNFGHPTSGQSNVFSKIRLNGSNIEVYYNTSNSHTCKFEIQNYDHNNTNITIYDFETTSQSEVSGSCFVCDFVNGTNTSGGVYQNGAPVFATDPSALTPSTANGWSQIGIKSDLPSEGTYYVYPSISGSVKLYGIATVVFDGTNNAFGATGGNFVLNVAYIPAQSTKWSFIFANGTELTPDYILFKRIN